VKTATSSSRLLRIGIDIRDLRLASTGTKTYLDELLKVFKKLDGVEIELKEFNSFWKPYWGHSKWGKGWEHIQFFIWKQITLPLKTLLAGSDVLICTDYYVPLIKFKAKHLVVFHDALFFDHPEYYNPIWLKLFKGIALPAARNADVIIAPSHFSKDRLLLHEKGFEGKIKVVYQGAKSFSLNEVLSKNSQNAVQKINGKPYILHVGVLEKRKNIANLIKAIHIVRQKQDVKLLLVGRPNPKIYNNSEAEILNTIHELGLEDDIVFTGYAPDDDLPILYKKAICYIFPSVYEGFGIPILEAFQHHIPVAVSDNSSLPEIGGNAVLSFDPSDNYKIADVIQKLMNDVVLRDQLITNGNIRFNQFSWEISGKEILAIAKSSF
jgi:glycosyltransferase involved in cell wall biosynthesis